MEVHKIQRLIELCFRCFLEFHDSVDFGTVRFTIAEIIRFDGVRRSVKMLQEQLGSLNDVASVSTLSLIGSIFTRNISSSVFGVNPYWAA